jgi:hypothetical protein
VRVVFKIHELVVKKSTKQHNSTLWLLAIFKGNVRQFTIRNNNYGGGGCLIEIGYMKRSGIEAGPS